MENLPESETEDVLAADGDRMEIAGLAKFSQGPALLEHDPPEAAFLEAVRRFSDDHLPCRGWNRMLEVGPGAGSCAILLAERGYGVTVIEPDELALGRLRDLFEQRGLEGTFVQPAGLEKLDGAFDAVFCFDPAPLGLEPRAAAGALRNRLRKHGLLFGGPVFAQAPPGAFDRRGFQLESQLGSKVVVLRNRGKLGRMVAGFAAFVK